MIPEEKEIRSRKTWRSFISSLSAWNQAPWAHCYWSWHPASLTFWHHYTWCSRQLPSLFSVLGFQCWRGSLAFNCASDLVLVLAHSITEKTHRRNMSKQFWGKTCLLVFLHILQCESDEDIPCVACTNRIVSNGLGRIQDNISMFAFQQAAVHRRIKSKVCILWPRSFILCDCVACALYLDLLMGEPHLRQHIHRRRNAASISYIWTFMDPMEKLDKCSLDSRICHFSSI